MRAESYVQKVADVTTGSRVTRGQPLMEIYSPAISSAAAEYVATITSKATANIEPYGRGSKQRLTNLDVPEAVIAEMEKSRNVPIAIPWTSPRDGIVLQRAAIEGMRAQPGDVLFRIADVSVVWALVDVAERDLGNIVVGQKVTVRARSYPGRSFAGQISVIYPQVNKETRTARVRIELENADLALLPDMISSTLLTLIVIPAIFAIVKGFGLRSGADQRQSAAVESIEERPRIQSLQGR